MATITVTNLGDNGAGSLRDAISVANPGDTINFDPGLTGGTLVLTSGELDILKNLTIDGLTNVDGTPDITISGGGISRVFDVAGGRITATLNNLVIENGYVAGANGGGIAVGGNDALTVRNSRLTGNVAQYVAGPGLGDGGAIYVSGTLTLLNTILSDNTAQNGGGIFDFFGNVKVANSTLYGNSAVDGGGVYNKKGTLTAVNATLSGNRASDGGGGINNFLATANLYDSTLTGNLGATGVGAIDNEAGTLTLSNSIVAGNDGQQQDDISGFFGTRISFRGNNILGSTSALVDGSTVDKTQGGYTTIDGRNAAVLQTVFASVGNDPNTSVLSGVLADNGGPVQTVAINSAGIAYNAGSNTALPPSLSVDARGLPRVVGGTVDIGAFEQQQGATYVVTTLADNPYDGKTLAGELAEGNGLSLRQALGLAAASGGPSTIAFAPNLAGGTIYLANGELDISSNVLIDGNVGGYGTPGITIDANNASRVFNETGGFGISATLDGLIIRGGNSGSAGPADNGGGIAVGISDGLTLTNSKVTNNQGYSGGGIYGAQGSTISLINTSVFGNSSDVLGGGIYAGIASTLTLTNATISGNYSRGSGGAMALGPVASSTLTNTTIAGNSTAGYGGGIDGFGSPVIKLYNSTLTGNYAGADGGGIYNSGAAGASVVLANSIVAGNAASGSGTDLELNNSPLTFEGSNILGSTPSNASAIDKSNGTYTQIDGTSQAALQTVFARVALNPHTNVLSGVLAANGGLVRTVAVNPTGPAYSGSAAALPHDTFDLNNNGNTTEPLPVDARGFSRVVGGTLDIGAFEQQPSTTFIVTTLADNPYDGGTLAQELAEGHGLSLRQAIGLANGDPTSADTIEFDPSLIGGSTHGVNDGALLLTNGQLKINGNVRIEGDITGDNAPHITIDGQGDSRDLFVLGGNVLLDGLTITGGYAYVHGGGVFLGTGAYGPANVTISHSIISNNQAAYGGGISINPGDSLVLTNSVVSGNSAYYLGGGIYNSGTAALVNSTISGNKGGYAGGGIYNSEDLQLTNVTIANNSAYNGGGLSNAPCGCGNSAIYDSTFTGNSAKQIGGGIYNPAGEVTLTNSLVAGNNAGYQGPDILTGSYGTTNYSGVNLFSQADAGRPGTDIFQPDLTQIFANTGIVDPDGVPNSGDEFEAGELTNNGGPTLTVALRVGGSAQNTGSTADLPPDFLDPAVPLSVDARGEPRVFGPGVDIGAVEVQGPVLTNVPASTNYTEHAPPVELSPVFGNANALTVTDLDASELTGATVTITTGVLTTDVLAADTAGTGISASYDTATGTLTLAGSETLADYSKVLDSVTFSSPGGNPDNFGLDPTRTVTWSATDAKGMTSVPATTTIAITATPTIPFDLNGDTVSDLVFQNNGTPQIWLWNGTSVTSQATFANPGASWHVITSRDVNGDGKADLIWQNSDGTPGIWLMNGTTPTAEVSLANPGSAWTVVGSGDFNGDGRADLLWQDVSGNVGVWEMNGTTPIVEAAVGNPGPNWKVVGAADFNADGHDDILLQNTATGNLMIDLMNGTSIMSTVSITVGDPSWHAVSAGEFNGQAEIVWQNSNGTPGLWLMNGTTPVAEAALPNPGAAWLVVSVDHFTPNGQADLLFQNANGAMGLWRMDGTTAVAAVNLPNPGAGWQSVNGHPFATG